MDNPIIQALRRARQAYMTNVGEPTAQLVGGGVRGYLGLDAPGYADSRGMEAYRNAAAISNTPVVGMPSMAVRAGAKAAPAIAQSLREHAKGFQEYNRALGPAGASQMVVWHGSPHKFDAFDASKIGTGEGAQAYGHGLYLAESPEVAKGYQTDLSRNLWKQNPPNDPIARATLERYNGDIQYAKDILREQVAVLRKNYSPNLAAAERGLIALENYKPPTGSFYKVDLPDEKIARMLDWDKPLSQQAPEVRKAAAKRLDEIRALGGTPPKDPSGEWLHKAFQPQAGEQGFGQALAADRLRAAGIPGIRYLDQGSRSNFRVQNTYKGKPYGEPVSFMTETQAKDYAAEQAAKGFGTNILPGTSNFVVFPGEEAALTILERNNEIINALRKRKPD